MIFYTTSYKLYHNFTEDEYIAGIISLKMFRGFTEMGLGILLHEIHKRKELLNQSRSNVVSTVCFLTVLTLSWSHGESYNYIYVILISIGVFFAFDVEITKCKAFIGFLSGLSYSIYLNHNIIRLYIMPKLFYDINTWYVKAVYLLMVICFAYIMSVFTDWLTKIANYVYVHWVNGNKANQ